MNNLVSVIIPVYNVEPYIETCLQSVTNQTITRGVECILVDDCGTDNSIQIAQRFVDTYQGNISFAILHHDQNRGLSAARNTGIRNSNGEYLFFLDSDDQIVTDCIEGFLRIVQEHPGIDLVQGLLKQDTPYMNQFLTKELPTYTEDWRYIKRALLNYDILPVCAANKMLRRQLIIDNDLFFKEGIIHEDNYWSFFLAKHVRSLAIYKEQCYLYTENCNSIMKAINREKEIHSYQTMIREFCANVDGFQRGAQRLCIYLLMDIMLRSQYYYSAEDRDDLFQQFCSVCNPVERLCLKRWYHVPVSSSQYNFWGRILEHLFRLY